MTKVEFNIESTTINHYIGEYVAFLAVDRHDIPSFFLITAEGNIVDLTCQAYSEYLEPAYLTIEKFCESENLQFVKAFAHTDEFKISVSER